MAFQISPGVSVSEVDLTTVVPSVLTTAGAFAGPFVWGPINRRINISSEIDLVARFGEPDNNTAVSFFTAASFLAYGNNLRVVRSAGSNTKNAQANTSTLPFLVGNDATFEFSYLNNDNNNYFGPFMARYAGAIGNSLTISVADASNFTGWTANGVVCTSYFSGAPGTSVQAAAAGSANDEMHIIVIDTGGLFTGTKNSVLETYPYISKAFNSIDENGNSNYYKQKIFNNSKYIYAVDPVDYANTISTWNLPYANNLTYASIGTVVPRTFSLRNGAYEDPSNANLITSYDQFSNADATDINLVLTGNANTVVQQYVIDNVVNYRKDCVAFISPPSSAVINQSGNEVTNIQTWLTSLNRSTSYAVADSGYKYTFDKYNNKYRYIPLNGDIAGLCVYTDSVRDPWYSPAGLNRGFIKNVIRLTFNPNQTERDSLYSVGVNPVISVPGSGTVLYGDKTLQIKPSAFDRINVRRLFITLEKTIAQAAKYSLFEFNDEFTRAQFVALVTPFLRDVQGRRGIYDFRVVCDTTNNTAQVIDSNQFVGDIYIKPARSINFIQLNFVAVRTGVDFTEVVGQF
jgi:hypothetical protein